MHGIRTKQKKGRKRKGRRAGILLVAGLAIACAAGGCASVRYSDPYVTDDTQEIVDRLSQQDVSQLAPQWCITQPADIAADLPGFFL